MPDDFATHFRVMLQRAADSIIDDIAKDGVQILKGVVDSAGFGYSELLKNYEVFAHVDGDEILFEIVIDPSALELEDKHAQEIVESARPGTVSAAARSYGMGFGGVRRVFGRRDARKKPEDRTGTRVKDGRKHVTDARRTANMRSLGHQLANHAPRSAHITKRGSLSVSFRRSLKEGTTEIKYPQGKLEGLIKEFIDKLRKAIANRFAPELERALLRRLK